VLGYILPALGIDWHYHSLVNIYKKLEQRGFKIVYLTARSFGEFRNTRTYLDGVVSGADRLPRGPILLSPQSFVGTLRTDIVTKTSDVLSADQIFKTRMLKEIQKAFRSDRCLVSGFGNQPSDAVAYSSVGMHPNFVFIIKDSIIHMLSGKFKFTMESFFNNVENLFPAVNCEPKKEL
jgi:phosphatidate phosphatase LPIN